MTLFRKGIAILLCCFYPKNMYTYIHVCLSYLEEGIIKSLVHISCMCALGYIELLIYSRYLFINHSIYVFTQFDQKSCFSQLLEILFNG